MTKLIPPDQIVCSSRLEKVELHVQFMIANKGMVKFYGKPMENDSPGGHDV